MKNSSSSSTNRSENGALSVGISFTGSTTKSNSRVVDSRPSLAVICKASVPLKFVGGVPESRCDAGSKLNHCGRAVPPARVTSKSKVSPSASVMTSGITNEIS